MGRSLLDRAAGFLLAQRRRKRWQKAVSAMAAVVVFCTTYALILPAITLSNDPICGKEEHVHTEECYGTELRYPQSSMACTLGSDGALVIHTHDKYCYSEDGSLICELPELEAHRHTGRCYREVRTLICGEEEDPGHEHTAACYARHRGDLICTEEEDEGHTHSGSCYDVDRELTCEDDSEEHEHDEGCYTETEELTCTEEERPGHTHSDSCYEWTEELTCTEEVRPAGHIHSDECYEITEVLDCGEEEVIPHTHDEGCYDTEDCPLCEEEEPPEHTHPLICGMEEVLEHQHTAECIVPPEGDPWEVTVLICGKEAHTHTEDCYPRGEEEPLPGISGGMTELPSELPEGSEEYICGLEEHTHTEDCYSPEGELTCTLAEHIHSEECLAEKAETPAYVCGLAEHTHSAACYDEAGEPICGLTEHVHDETCLTPAEAPLRELSYTGSDYTVSVSFGEDAALPENVTLAVREITAETEEYQTYYDQTVAALQKERTEEPETLVFARFFDICFQLDGAEVEPAGPVSVTITYAEPVDTDEAASCKAIHFAEEGTELLEAKTETLEDGEVSFTHTQESFSVVGSVVTFAASNAVDVGPDLLPVDYYVFIDGKWTCVGSTRTGWYGDSTATGWQNDNRDCITVDQAALILGPYGFDVAASDAGLQIAYQRKETDKDPKLHCDTHSYTDNDKSNAALIPLARNADRRSGYNVYFLPGNTGSWSSGKQLSAVETTGSEFYTVSVYDPNHLAYQEGETLPESRTVRTGGNIEITVKALPEDCGAVWQCVDSKWQAVASDTDDGETVTFSLTNVTQKLVITPVANDLGEAVNKTVYCMVFLDGQWQNVGTITPYYKNPSLLVGNNNYRHFITSSQAESVLAPFGFRSNAYSSTVGGASVLAHQLGAYNLDLEFWTDGGGEQLSDGSWAIGLSYVTNGEIDYSVYYLPTDPGPFQGKIPNQCTADMTDNSFWSVSVRDDSGSVYSDGELSGMVQYVLNGGSATVTVRNGDGVIWSVAGASEVDETQSGGCTTFVITNITQPVEVTATRANPGFTVQYYANIDRYVLGNSGDLDIIDTSGGNLPGNTSSQSLLWLTLEDTKTASNQNNGNNTTLHRVKTEKQLTQMYTDGTYNFEEHPGLEYFDKLWGQSNYLLDAVLVLKDGKSPDSMNDDDWWWYKVNQSTWDNITFTNIASEEKAPRQEGVKQSADGTYCILLEEGTVLRLRYETNEQSYTNRANFHDYDITSGQNSDGTWRSGITGINNKDNYVLSGNGQRKFDGTKNADAAKDVFAFGNANCETGLGLAQWGGNNINAYNGQKFWMSNGKQEEYGNSVYKGCTFGLVTGLNGNGDLVWDPWITAPRLFDEGAANGKHSYNNGSLQFNQTGDTYTLTAADSSVGNRSNLEYFFNPSPYSGKTHTHIFTNNFWPMDSATNKTDPLMGKSNADNVCDVKVNGFWDEQNRVGDDHKGVRVPISDDGRAHNWFFGMNFALSFTLTEDYLGPLEYIFFGDDDLWVFLDGKLICDIGGVHSSVGEFVNLRDYLPVDGDKTAGTHTLSFFYTERGASGSTCWMSFTLPSVTSATTGRDIGSLQIAKTLGGGVTGLDDQEYEFKVELLTSENGSPLNQTFNFSRSDGTYGTVKSGGIIKLKNGETVTIRGIPAGAFYRVTEESRDGYKVSVNNAEGYIASGTIESGAVKPASFVNTPYYELPETGGGGTGLYTMVGALLMGGAVCLLYSDIRRRKEENSSTS